MPSRKQEFRSGTEQFLSDPRYELLPFDEFEEAIQPLPDGARVTVTASPQCGIDATVEKTTYAIRQGYEAVPHLAARSIKSKQQLDEILGTFSDIGVRDLFVPGGDRDEPAGPFSSAHDLLVCMEDLGYSFQDVGITGYPEGHPFLDDSVLSEAMQKKSSCATYIVTQLCYHPGHILDWVKTIRNHRDIDLRVHVGLPGVLKYQELIGITKNIGLSQSLKFLNKTTGILGFLKQLIGSWGYYRPDELVDEIAPRTEDPELQIGRAHIYTFNKTQNVENWRLEKLND